MNCSICNEPIFLSPSAAERAAKDVTGKTAAYYTSLFRTHATCELDKRKRDTSALMQRLKETEEKSKVSWEHQAKIQKPRAGTSAQQNAS